MMRKKGKVQESRCPRTNFDDNNIATFSDLGFGGQLTL